MSVERPRRGSMQRIRLATGLVAGFALVVAGCGGGATASPSAAATPAASASAAALPSPEAGTFRMGTEPWLGYGPWWIADDQGLFAKNGVTATVTNFDTDDLINAALVSGQLDGANIATHTALRLISEGTPITIVLLLDQSNAADAILAGPGVASVAEMKGKSVAYEEGTTSDILLRYALSQNGMTIDDVTRVSTPAAQAGIAAIAKKVDVAVTYEPYLTAALQQDSSFKLIYTAGEKPGLIGDVFVVRNDYLAGHPGQVYALLKAWGDAVAYYRSSTADGQAIIEKAVGADAGSLKTAFDGVQLYSLGEAKQLMTGGGYGTTLADVKQIAADAGIITNPVDTTKVMDTSYITAVVP